MLDKYKKKNMLPLEVYSPHLIILCKSPSPYKWPLCVVWDDKCAYINLLPLPWGLGLSEPLCLVPNTQRPHCLCVKIHLKAQCQRFSSINW